MDAASILLILAAAGQAGWTPERSTTPPPASASSYDRYAQPPSAPASRVAPPPSVVDRTRTAITESGAALRDGFEAGVEAANQQLQGWTDSAGRQLQSTGNNLRAATEQSLGVRGQSATQSSNPFGPASSPPPAANPRSRSGVAPPPWADASATTAPNWDTDTTETGPAFGRSETPGFERRPSGSGWTSIGSQVAAPPLLVPPLRTSASTATVRDLTGSGGSSIATPTLRREPAQDLSSGSSRQAGAPAAGADSWATGWGDHANAAPATISRSGDTTARGEGGSGERAATQTANARPQDSQQKSGNSWADLWGGQDPWGDAQKASPSGTPAAPVATTAPASVSNNTAGQPLLGPPANATSGSTSAAGVLPPANGTAAPHSTAPPVAPTDQPPWLPLLVVSLSLAGSLGANLFLGWSYLDARQRYRTLVRKTADKFRRAVAA